MNTPKIIKVYTILIKKQPIINPYYVLETLTCHNIRHSIILPVVDPIFYQLKRFCFGNTNCNNILDILIVLKLRNSGNFNWSLIEKIKRNFFTVVSQKQTIVWNCSAVCVLLDTYMIGHREVPTGVRTPATMPRWSTGNRWIWYDDLQKIGEYESGTNKFPWAFPFITRCRQKSIAVLVFRQYLYFFLLNQFHFLQDKTYWYKF